MKKLTILLVAFSLVSCIKKKLTDKKPEDAVRHFIEVSGSVKDAKQKEDLGKLCTGDMRRAFDRMSDESFKLSYVNQAIRLRGIKIVEEKIDGETARISYEVRLENFQGTSPTEEINEREIELKLVDNQWLVDSIRTKGSDKVAFTRGMIF